MPRALLVNDRGHASWHQCIRLEMLETEDGRGIFAIFRCSETDEERVFGCLDGDTPLAEIGKLYPGVPLHVFQEEEVAA